MRAAGGALLFVVGVMAAILAVGILWAAGLHLMLSVVSALGSVLSEAAASSPPGWY